MRLVTFVLALAIVTPALAQTAPESARRAAPLPPLPAMPAAAPPKVQDKVQDQVPAATREKVSVKGGLGASFALAWTTTGLGNPSSAVSSTGEVDFKETPEGIVNTNWTRDPSPATFPRG